MEALPILRKHDKGRNLQTMDILSETVATTPSIADDRAAIASVIDTETRAFIDADFEEWASCFVQEERFREVSMNSRTGLSVICGWADFSENVQRVMTDDLGCKMVDYRKDNMQITVDQDTAWVVYDGWALNAEGISWESFTTCILERNEFGWRIVYHAFADVRNDQEHAASVSVDKDGRLIWASCRSLEKIKKHPILTISAGRVRARRQHWDNALQEVISHAGRFHSYFELRRFTDDCGEAFEYPSVLGHMDDGGVAVIHVCVRDNVTYLQFDSTKTFERRMALAQAVFGLSDGQRRVAHQIALGVSLKRAADALEISVNTVRTHLARLYEKTGVSSQTALVRILLSVG